MGKHFTLDILEMKRSKYNVSQVVYHHYKRIKYNSMNVRLLKMEISKDKYLHEPYKA